MIGLRTLALLACVVGAAGTARAAACPEAWESASGPLPGGTGPADFGAIAEACPASDIAVRLRGALLVASAMPDFYGSIVTSATVRVRRAIGMWSWVSLAFDAIDYRYVNNGGLASSGFSSGPPTIGYYRTLVATPRMTTALYGRALLPLDSARRNSIQTGLEIGSAIRAPIVSRAVLDGGLGMIVPTDVAAGQVHGRLLAVALAEAWYAARPSIAVGAGGAVNLELAPTPTFVTAVPRFAARFALQHRFWMAVLVELPILGADRTDLVASAFVGYSP